MAFESIHEFIYMGGHGVYVWSAFIISITLLKILLWKPLWEKQQLLKSVRQQMDREKIHPRVERE
jgi:heme exporter protein D